MYVISLSYKTSSLDIRKIFAFSSVERSNFIKKALSKENITECVLLSTCNRTEIYFNGELNALETMEELIANEKHIDLKAMMSHFNVYKDEKAIYHLFKVTCGMESMLLGEDEILGQVKEAFQFSLEEGATSFTLNTIFKQAITAAKKAKTVTAISRTPVSLGTLAAKIVFDLNLKEKNVLIIGVNGKMGTVVAKNILAKNNINVFGTLRTHNATDTLDLRYSNLTYIDYNNRYQYIEFADVIISATSSPHYTVTYNDYNELIPSKKERIFIDLAVPPDIDKNIMDVEGIKLYNIDYFESLAKENNVSKEKEIECVHDILLEHYNEALKTLDFSVFHTKFMKFSENKKIKDLEKIIYKARKVSKADEFRTFLKVIENVYEG